MNESIALFVNGILSGFLMWVYRTWYLFLPIFLGYLFWTTWLSQLRAKFIKNLRWVLLEIKIPRDVAKSPKAIEASFSSLYSTFAGTPSARFLKGFLPGWYSLEIASIGGQVHFFIRAQKPFRNLVESQIYAHYPDAEISEVPDYTYASDFENFSDWNLWGVEFGLNKDDVYPIRTYVDFGLHESVLKEEQKVNPLVSFLEFLGSLKESEQAWFQILIKGAGKDWADKGRATIDELLGRSSKSGGESEKKEEKKLSKGESEIVSAIEKNISRLGFETGIRTIYVARRDIFNPINIASVIGVMNQYSFSNLNGFKPLHTTATGFLFKSFRELRKKRIMLDAFRKRSYFYAPYKRKPFVFNAEELATIYHFPGRVAETPTFGRVESKKGEPPATLPI